MAEQEYQRLTWSRRRQGVAVITVARASLWLGGDHLLCIETNGYVENYKRFYFRDIQGIITRKTMARMVTNIVLGVMAALLLMIGFLAASMAVLITLAIVALVLCGIPLLINVLLGPTCTCQIRTAVQTEDLPIGRVRKVQKVLERIRPLIALAQGQLDQNQIAGEMQALVASANAPAAAPSPQVARYVIDDLNLPPRIIS